MTVKPIADWSIDDYARHYVETLAKPVNGWGQHRSPLFGQSHHIMIASARRYGSLETYAAIDRALKEKPKCA